MKRYTLHANFRLKPMKKFIPLFEDERTYKTYSYAQKVRRQQCNYNPHLRINVIEVEVRECPECKQAVR